ncbi:uncharacterized protein A1O5_02932 [Cladophialophora psammophila CBS 110553]|uniref:O-methyltransferase C-terminal domain-containing protein n=1 Tax=Cladophialophora psammophila CBS 110553 TaxID=1182543 RepID=W9XBD0_9EURO|nr:uncharacterized protein A1O5_02932 [Cladophialophora psammophila CBS 110553]EXJ74635.1 hypothetical protein A1O5_02932 [Cladophialophora psammophila CBS 110553]
MTKGIFVEIDGDVAHTQTSMLLLGNGIAILSKHSSDRGWPFASRFNDAIEKWGHDSPEPNETAFNIFKNTDLSMFEYHEQHPESSADSHAVKNQFTKSPPLSHEHVKSAFEWSGLSHARVFDVGGSPKNDRPAAAPSTSIVPAHMKSRINFHEDRFWDPQRVAADSYFLRTIFHDWADKYTKKILQALLVAMKPGSRILIMDYVTLPYGTLKIGNERRMRIRDMQMMVMHNALERDEGEWRRLFAETDSN